MKKILCLFILVLLLIVSTFEVNATGLDDSTITKFDYYPTGSLSNNRELTIQWTSNEKMENLSVRVYLPKQDNYAELYNMAWEEELNNNSKEKEVITDEEEIIDPKFEAYYLYKVEFEIVDYPIDDPLTLDIDESLEGDYIYRISFLYDDNSLSIIKIVFEYDAVDNHYLNNFYLTNIVNPYIKPEVDDEKEESYFTTKNALFAASFAAFCSVIGTVLIIYSTGKKIEDDEEIE